MLVSTWMTPDPISVGPHVKLREAEDLMRESGFRHLPVVEEGRLVGILTMNDVRRAGPSAATTLSKGEVAYLLDQIEVRDAMTRSVITVTPETPVEEAALLAYQKKIGALPVMSEERLVGIITQSDLFDIMMSIFEGKEGSRRITIEGLPAQVGTLRKLIDILDAHRVPLSSILVFPMRDSGLYTYFVRVPDRDVDAIVGELSAQGLPVSHVV